MTLLVDHSVNCSHSGTGEGCWDGKTTCVLERWKTGELEDAAELLGSGVCVTPPLSRTEERVGDAAGMSGSGDSGEGAAVNLILGKRVL